MPVICSLKLSRTRKRNVEVDDRGSILAHTALVSAVLVMPILSALDNYVVSAHKLIYTPPYDAVTPVPPPPGGNADDAVGLKAAPWRHH
jgi:hypothetical protein